MSQDIISLRKSNPRVRGFVIEFLTAAQLQALGAAIQKARTRRGIHSVRAPDGEVFAYPFDKEVYWHVHGSDHSEIARGTVPI